MTIKGSGFGKLPNPKPAGNPQNYLASGCNGITPGYDGLDFFRADLAGAALTGGDLHDAVLTGADLRGAILSDADLRRADLRYTDLTGADLSNANLAGADLTGAHLSGVRLSRADLTGAIWPKKLHAPVGWVRVTGSARLQRARAGG